MSTADASELQGLIKNGPAGELEMQMGTNKK
jgi:hypothetical protein